jgi:hypothetical protein
MSRAPVLATAALSSDPVQPVVFGGTARTEFVRLSYDLSSRIVVGTNSRVVATAIVAPGDELVYYVESEGIIHEASATDLSDVWKVPFDKDANVEVRGEIALDSVGAYLYVADRLGTVRAFAVGDTTLSPSEAPSSEPSEAPSVPPTAMPSTRPSTTMPTASPSATLSASPTTSMAPTSAPVLQCGDFGAPCGSFDECCSQRCTLLTCQKKITTPKLKLGAGRGGAGGVAKTGTVRGR